MNKVRVYEVARELGLENRELIQRIAALGIQVRNHMSVLDAAEVDRVKRALEKDKAETMVEERIRPTVVRRRTRKKEPAPEPAPEPVAAQPRPAPAPVVRPPVAEPAPRPVVSPEPVAATPEPAPEPAPARAAEPPPTPEPEPPAPVVAPEPAPEPTPAPVAAAPEPAPAPAPPAPEPAVPAEPEVPEDRFSRPFLPPGVTRRGNTHAPGAVQLSDAKRAKIVADHASARPAMPRRREIRGRAAIGPTGRPQGRPGKKKMAPGKRGKQTEITVPSAKKRKIRIEDQIQLQELAAKMSLKSTDVLMKLMQMGVAGVHINSTLDADTAAILAEEFNYEVENVARSEEEVIGDARGEFLDDESDREPRAPIVTVMGHVDHGKTSLLDRIRKEDVAAGEAGGITQHIGAYRVDTDRGTVVFLDTPGHEAFTSMRARGAQATDVVVLVCAADDGVMPQTKEAVAHAKAAEVPIVVAVNKIDRPDANAEKVMNELAAEGLQPEEWGGDTIYVPCSAITGEGVDKLLESVLLTAELLELKANSKIPAKGVVLEAHLDRGRGPVANVLVRDGSLKAGDYVVAGAAWGRVRAMRDDRNRQVRIAGPATPVEIQGLSAIPSAGDGVYQVTNAKKAQEVAEARGKQGPKPIAIKSAASGLETLQAMLESGDVQDLNLVLKADVQGSIEALHKSLTDASTAKVKVKVIHTGVGGITENDVMLASASKAIVLGFGVRPQGQASRTAKNENVEVRTYSVIYEAIDDVKKAMAGLLAPKLVEKELGKAEIREVFTIPKVGSIGGCFVTEGKVLRNGKARLVRDGIVVWEGGLASLRRFKDDVREVASGYECGIGLQNFNDIKEQDVIEVFEIEEVEATLDD